jgi:hypothetical protein
VYGPPKIGKSTFASRAKGAIILGSEDGADNIDCPKFPAPTSWGEVLEAVQALTTEQHEYKALVLDTLDWLEPLLAQHVCEQHRKQSLEEFGYGRGYDVLVDEWRKFIARLERLRAKDIHVIALAHAHVRTFQNPAGPDYDRWELKLNKRSAGLWSEWVDVVAFANWSTNIDKREGKASGHPQRMLYTSDTATCLAGSRYQIPPSMPLDWATFASALKTAFDKETSNAA